MKENIKNNEFQERLTYVPASVQVFEVTAHEAILAASVSIRRNAYCSGERSSLLLQKIEIL